MTNNAGQLASRFCARFCFAIGLICAVAVGGCTKPSQYSETDVVDLDDNTSYRITEIDGGFRILVNYDEYQWWPSRGRSHQACRDILIRTAEQHSQQMKRKIVAINENLIRVDSGRNILTGYTTCTATYKVEWKDGAAGS